MKSVIAQGATVTKAIEEAHLKAGKPQEFFIKILEDAQSGFLGFGVKKAKIALFFKKTDKRHESSFLSLGTYKELFENEKLQAQPEEQDNVSNQKKNIELTQQVKAEVQVQKPKIQNNKIDNTQQRKAPIVNRSKDCDLQLKKSVDLSNNKAASSNLKVKPDVLKQDNINNKQNKAIVETKPKLINPVQVGKFVQRPLKSSQPNKQNIEKIQIVSQELDINKPELQTIKNVDETQVSKSKKRRSRRRRYHSNRLKNQDQVVNNSDNILQSSDEHRDS